MKKIVVIMYILLFLNSLIYAVDITPMHTGTITSFTNWTHSYCDQASKATNDFIKMVKSTSTVISPTITFNNYLNEVLVFKAGTFGTVNNSIKTITVSISTDNGVTWTTLGTRLPADSNINTQSSFDLSSYNSDQVKIRIQTLGADGTNGIRLDDISITGTLAPSGPANPVSFTANAFSTSQITLSATANENNNNILVAYNSSNTFGTPSETYIEGNAISGGGTVLYNGVASGLGYHIGLTPNQTVYYKAWSYDGSAYSTGLIANATTLSPLINIAPTTLSGFSYIIDQGPSTEQSFTVSGSNLTTEISINAPTNYEISKTSGSGYANPLTFSPTDGTVSEQTVYVRLKADLTSGTYNSQTITATSTGAIDKTVTCSGSVTTPSITINKTSLTGFTYSQGTGPSSEKNFTVSGSSLKGDIIITAPTNYEISTGTGGSFVATSPITLPKSGTDVSSTTIYVRLKAELNQETYSSESINITSTDATSQTVTCSGSVTAPAPTIQVLLRPTHIDLSSNTSESAVLMNASYYNSNDAKYRIYGGSGQYYCWNETSNTFISNTSYSAGPRIIGTPSTSSTWWVIFQNGNNNSINGTYRDKLNPYSSDNKTLALPSATSISSPFSLSGVIEGSNYDLNKKYVVLGFAEEALITATSTALTTGAYTLKVPTGTTISKIEVRSIENETKLTKTGSWNSTTESITLPVTLSSFTATPDNNNQAVTLQWITQSESDLLGYYIYRNDSNQVENSTRQSSLIPPYNTSTEQTYNWTDSNVTEGEYYYWLMSIEKDGSTETHGSVKAKIGETTPETPNHDIKTAFNNIYPNPFNPSTTMSYSLAEASNVNIRIYNIKGELIKEYYELGKNKGNHAVVWNGKDKNNNPCGSGVYFFQLQAGKYHMTKKALLMK